MALSVAPSSDIPSVGIINNSFLTSQDIDYANTQPSIRLETNEVAWDTRHLVLPVDRNQLSRRDVPYITLGGQSVFEVICGHWWNRRGSLI